MFATRFLLLVIIFSLCLVKNKNMRSIQQIARFLYLIQFLSYKPITVKIVIFDLSRALIPTEASDNFDPMKTFVEPFILKKEGHLGFPVSIIV